MGYGQALSLPHSFSQQIKAGRQKKKKKSEEPTSEEPARLPQDSPVPPSFSLSLLFLPFVFRGSCCNPADHQQLPFQRHLTLPNPRPSLHPDIANAPPPRLCRVTPRGRSSQSPPPSPRPRRVHKVTPFQIQAIPS